MEAWPASSSFGPLEASRAGSCLEDDAGALMNSPTVLGSGNILEDTLRNRQMPPPVAILRIGLDQAARSPAATAESLNFTHFGSKDVSTEDGPSKVSGRSARSRMRADASAFPERTSSLPPGIGLPRLQRERPAAADRYRISGRYLERRCSCACWNNPLDSMPARCFHFGP